MKNQFFEFSSILELLKVFKDEQTCIDHLENILWSGTPVSPFDPSSKVYKCKNNRYKCRNSNKYFNVRTGTIFEDTKIPLQTWFLAIYLIASHKKGISSHQLARDLSITQKSAWFMAQRIRYAFGHENFKHELKDEVEIDETFIGGQWKNKHAKKRIRESKGTGYANKVPVFGMLQRNGIVIAQAVEITQMNGKHLKPIIYKNVAPDATIITDCFGAYYGLNEKYHHETLDHGKYQYVKGNYHTNTIEGFWSLFKRGITGIYHSISPAHTDRYVQEFCYRYNTRDINECERFNLLLSSTNRRLTYNNLISHGKK